MTYLHVTTKCNMACAHCIHDYGAGKRGRHMDWNTFLGAVNFVKDYAGWEHITLGGGEPTLNPDILKMLDHLVECGGFDYVLMVTNGSKAKVMREIIERYESGQWEIPKHGGNIEVVLSWDVHHDQSMVEPFVSDYFIQRGLTHDVGWNLIRGGRAAKLPDSYTALEDKCVCNNLVVYPDGRVTACGCPGSPKIAQIVHHGYDMEHDAQELLESPQFMDTRCARPLPAEVA